MDCKVCNFKIYISQNFETFFHFFKLKTLFSHTFKEDPIFIKFFSSRLSNTGSISSPISWISKGRPIDTESSRWFLKYLCVSHVIWKIY